nr:C1 family peptidase [Saccharothrix deserti]
MLIDDAAVALADEGQPPLQVWPYNASLGIGTENPPNGIGSPPWHTAAVHELHLAHDGIEDELEDYLAAAVPIVLIVEVTPEFAYPDGNGYVRLPNLRTAAGDYHAVFCVGAATDPTRGRHLLIRNSWGSFWGSGGYCWLPTEYLIAFTPYAAIVLPSASPPATT